MLSLGSGLSPVKLQCSSLLILVTVRPSPENSTALEGFALLANFQPARSTCENDGQPQGQTGECNKFAIFYCTTFAQRQKNRVHIQIGRNCAFNQSCL